MLRRDILPPVSVPSGVITTWAAAPGGSFLFSALGFIWMAPSMALGNVLLARRPGISMHLCDALRS